MTPPDHSAPLGPRRGRRVVGLALLSCVLAALGGCERQGPGPTPTAAPVAASPPRDEVPPNQLAAVIAAHYRGLGAMERYEYAAAVRAFREVHERAPGWTTGTINLAIALLNQGGEAVERAGKAGQGGGDQESKLNIEVARELLDGVIAAHPDDPHALFSRGIILRSQGRLAEAHRDFTRVAKIDPQDGHTWLEVGASLTDPTREGMPAGKAQADELVAIYSRALEANPYLLPAMFKLQWACNLTGDRARQREWYARFSRLDPKKTPDGSGDVGETAYGWMGKYAEIINPFPRPGPPRVAPPTPRFGPPEPIALQLAPGDRWAAAGDFQGRNAALGRARDRFGAGVATFDYDRDGLLDLYLTAAVVGPAGLRDALLINRGDGKFEDRTAAAGLPLDRAGLGVAAADFDADLNVDLYLTGIGDNRLLRQDAGKFVDVTRRAGVEVADAISLTARWFDLDQDGDLDLYVINHARLADRDEVFGPNPASPGMPNAAFRNDGVPAQVGSRPEDNLAPLATSTANLRATQGLSIAFSTNWPAREVLEAGTARHTAFAALDIENDRDLDLVISSDGAPPTVLLNDRAGAFRSAPMDGWEPGGPTSGLLVVDLDKDGLADVVGIGPGGRAAAWRNGSERAGATTRVVGKPWPLDARGWRSATAADVDLDTWSDLVGLAESSPNRGIEWARNEGERLAARPLGGVPPTPEPRVLVGATFANLAGDALPDLLTWPDGEAPRLSRNLGNGQHWLAVDLAGKWRVVPENMRTNSEGLGTRLALEGQGIYNPVEFTTPQAGMAQSVGPFVLGLGPLTSVPLLRIRWPDGIMQSELNVAADKTLNLVELNRKTGSCPILFTWNGARFECLGDFAGAAGLGFLEAPGEYHPPDRDEAMAIRPEQLREVGGKYRLSVVEPMDEIAYLDLLTLDVVDRPAGVGVLPDERFAFGDARPTGELFAWTRTIPLVAAEDHRGRSVLPQLAQADRRTADDFRRVRGWPGYTEDHAVILDFGADLEDLRPGEEPVLCLTGWVEYPYSQTNYAAASAGVPLRPPVLEQRAPDGSWKVVDAAMGHPAGLTRTMTINLTGKRLAGKGTAFRIATNMECYWDQAFIAVRDPAALRDARVASLPVAAARLRDRGYLRESSPDGLQPILPDYDKVDPMPLARLRGSLTRHGDVADLLRADDDRLCVMGPGDEVELEFDAGALPPLAAGWTRSFVFRSVAYCKDADPFTATSDAVEPLPWRGMPPFPFPPGGERPADEAYATYLRDYQTRPAGER